MTDSLISVIVPVYNCKEYLDRCITSILDQTYGKIELVLVDDGSTDGSGEVCDRYAGEYGNVIVIHQKNSGPATARNNGLDAARGEYIGFVDSDDWIEPDMYEKMHAYMVKNDLDIVCCGRADVDSETGNKKVELCPDRYSTFGPEGLIRKILTWDGTDTSVCDKLFKRKCWENNRFPMGFISEDAFALFRTVKCTKVNGEIPEPFYNYFHHSNSRTAFEFKEEQLNAVEALRDLEIFIKEHYVKALPDFYHYEVIQFEYYLTAAINSKDKMGKRFGYASQILKRELKKAYKKSDHNDFSSHDRKVICMMQHPYLYIMIKRLYNMLKKR